jgi:hypothetical protein
MGNARIAECYNQIGKGLSDADNIGDYEDVDVLDVAVDVSDKEISNYSKKDESWQEAKVYVDACVQSGPIVMVMNELSTILM